MSRTRTKMSQGKRSKKGGTTVMDQKTKESKQSATRFIPVPKEADQWVNTTDIRHLCRTTVEAKLAELAKRGAEEKDGWTIYTGLGGQAYLYWLLSTIAAGKDTKHDQREAY